MARGKQVPSLISDQFQKELEEIVEKIISVNSKKEVKVIAREVVDSMDEIISRRINERIVQIAEAVIMIFKEEENQENIKDAKNS